MKASRLFGAASIASALFFVAMAWVTFARLRYPYDLEWMEGGVLDQAARFASGADPYPAPSSTFVPFLYPPLYPWLVATLGALGGGVSYGLARGISAFATIVTMGLGARAVFRLTGRPELGLLTIGLMSALYSYAGSFQDLARPDALAMALVMAGAVVAVDATPGRAVSAGLLLAAACFAKQTAFIAAVGVLAGVWLTQGTRRAATIAVTASVAGGVVFTWWQLATQGRFALYVVKGHRAHRFYRDNFGFYFYRDALHIAPLVLLAPLAWLRRTMRASTLPLLLAAHLTATVVQRFVMTRDLPHMYFRDLWYPHPTWAVPVVVIAALFVVLDRSTRGVAPKEPPAHLVYWGAVFLGGLFASAFGHSTQWAYKNSLLPLATVAVPFVVLSLHALTDGGRAQRPTLLAAAAVAVQLVALVESPARLAPGPDDAAGWEALRARLARVPGETMVLGHPFFDRARGASPHLHGMGVADMAALGGVPDFDARLARHDWAAIVVDVGDGMGVPPNVARYYRLAERMPTPRMRTGSLAAPSELWVPR